MYSSWALALWWLRVHIVAILTTVWYFWTKALGETQEAKSHREVHIIALIRTMFVLLTIITQMFIIVGVIYHWK